MSLINLSNSLEGIGGDELASKPKPKIRNVYRDGLPMDKATVVGASIVLKPVLASDFISGLHTVSGGKKEARAALLFEIIGVGPSVDNKVIEVGSYCVVSETSLDFANPEGTCLICEEQDIKLVFKEQDLK
jgi:hypothetical protein